MEKIEAKEFLKIWRKLADFEQLSDRGLCLKLGISPLTATYWKTGKTKTVRVQLLRRIREKLGYRIEIREDGSLAFSKPRHEPQLAEPKLGFNDDRTAYRLQARLFARLARQDDLWAESAEQIGSGVHSPFGERDLQRCVWYYAEDDRMKPIAAKGDALLLRRQTENIELGLVILLERGATPRMCKLVKQGAKILVEGIGPSSSQEVLDRSNPGTIYSVLCTAYVGKGPSEPLRREDGSHV